METIKFDVDETFELWHALRHAIINEKKNLQEYKELNKNGGYKSLVIDTIKSLDILEKAANFIHCYDEIKIEGD